MSVCVCEYVHGKARSPTNAYVNRVSHWLQYWGCLSTYLHRQLIDVLKKFKRTAPFLFRDIFAETPFVLITQFGINDFLNLENIIDCFKKKETFKNSAIQVGVI